MIRDTVQNFKRKLHGKIFAYNQVFSKTVHAEVVLKDLSRFCRAHSSTFHPDARIHAMLEGRREVWLRIQEHLQMTMEEIYKLHKIKEIEEPNDKERRET